MSERKLPQLDDLMPLLGDDEVLRTAREYGLHLSLPMEVLDKLNVDVVRKEVVAAAREAVRGAVLISIYNKAAAG
jgi:hypothetical protein